MFRWKCRFKSPDYRFEAYRRDLLKMLLEEVSAGAFQWLDAVLAVIPTWSGASRATFLSLSREIAYPLVINPTAFAPDRTSLGQRTSGGDFDTSKLQQGIVTFTYTTQLKHLIYNEFNNANVTPDSTLFSRLLQPGPYGFQERGREAFERVMAGIEMLDPTDSRYLKIKRRTVG